MEEKTSLLASWKDSFNLAIIHLATTNVPPNVTCSTQLVVAGVLVANYPELKADVGGVMESSGELIMYWLGRIKEPKKLIWQLCPWSWNK